MTENIIKESDQWLRNPHDKFGRNFLQRKAIASDLLTSYCDHVIVENVDLDELQPAPTHGVSKVLKEIIMDVSYLARLRDSEAKSEVLFVLEHKSRPSPMVALQVGTQAFLALYSAWTDANYSESPNFELPIPIMVVVYHGTENWVAKEIWFHELFKNIPPALRDLIPRFKVLVINLRLFQYGNLPGRPLTRAFVESLMRATDGTFAKELASVFQHVYEAGLEKTQTWDCIQTITGYCAGSVGLTKEDFEQAILKVFNKEDINMLETIPSGMLRDGFVLGRNEGIAIGKAEGVAEGIAKGEIRATLKQRFGGVPQEIKDTIQSMTDLVALESLLAHAETCKSLDEFSEALK